VARSSGSFDVHSQRSIRVTLHHDGVSAPNISSVTYDHNDSCELPPFEGGGSPNQCFDHSRTNANTGIPAQTPPLRLPRQATTAEFRVISLIAQHDPEANPELPRRRDAGFREALLHDLPSIEALQVGIASHGMRGRLAPEKSPKRASVAAAVPRAGARRPAQVASCGESTPIGAADRLH